MKLLRKQDAVELAVSHDPDQRKHVLLANGVVKPFLQISEFTLLPGKQITPHAHRDAVETFYLLEGSATFVVNGVSYQVSVGDVIVIEPGDQHHLKSHSESPARMFCLLVLAED
jgi:quercetin dioxygenase-like cupin family protein